MENYAVNRPGVVMIRTEYSANVYVNSMKMNNKAFNALLDSIQRLDQAGGVSAEQKLDIVLREMNNHPTRFFQTTFDYIKQPEQITATGTGFFLTGDGYVATNCHLIDRDNAFIRRQFILSAFQQITDASIAALENSWATTFNEQQRSLLYNTYASVYSRLFSMILYGLKKDIYVVYRSDREDKGPGTEKKLATIVRKGQPMPGKDVAILKIEAGGEMPVLAVADNRLPRVGEQLFVYGYPGPVTNNDFLAAESAIEPTLTSGIVSAIKHSVGGWPLIQMDANINHGSSGGPVCNEKGEVVGLTTFGSLENTGGLAAGLNFAVPVAILGEYLDTAGITPRLSSASRLFGQAVSFYDKGHYKAALRKFLEVKKMNDAYPGLYVYINSCQESIKKGMDHYSSPVERVQMIFAGLLLATGLLAWWGLRRLSRKRS
ncbi:trypsin-like peptidase domain-containing protein [Flavitalea sp. BT771]|uniref:S1C family serine protease n=1 Tax=Flavitalea sp. BT771 TaxID=3063329 RepID=UPI0026E36F7E|nr:trypsin-like peptidase domain-containing protein [Flavitalea sp. BT771]MDO6429152.1 trypsin-like peptidase domain-containing protein [Flavitalea sp. BT771]MDV6218720.1 trypsin-like peptidase domain-containing protein [Flavitalea sp. BT771]